MQVRLHSRRFLAGFRPTPWDGLAFALIFGLLLLFGHGVREAWQPLAILQAEPVSLDPANLPAYALYTTLRMLAALAVSFLFTLGYATLAARSARAGKLMIPALDILQSIPVLGYLSFTVTFFLALFPGRMMGAECAAIFAIFTSQAWNMAFSLYQSLTTLPRDLVEVAASLRLTAWQRFWKLDLPYAMPGLVWNMMMSMSGSWFFVVASEALVVGQQQVMLPGIGSYLAVAIDARDLGAVGWVVLTMLVVIILYDQVLFRPLVAWSEKFNLQVTASVTGSGSWLLTLGERARLIQTLLVRPAGRLLSHVAQLPLGPRLRWQAEAPASTPGWPDRLWLAGLTALALWALWSVWHYLAQAVDFHDVLAVFGLGALTLLRVAVLIVLASLVWVPVGVWIGLRPQLAGRVQAMAQFLAAFPANLLFPACVVLIIHFRLDPNVWLSPLLIFGTQWYILFNVVAGAQAFPAEYREVASNLQIRGGLWWRKVMLPGIFPYFLTGALTASGGAWNASIVGEYVSWGNDVLVAKGLGSYIAEHTASGQHPQVLLGILVMAVYVVLFNRLLWRPLQELAERRLSLA